MQRFHKKHVKKICHLLAEKDDDLHVIIKKHGYPPFWTRPNKFSSLILIILEQQVSLASAKAAFLKLAAYTGGITPRKLLALSDAELRTCYFSRQKTIYARELATAITSRSLQLSKLDTMNDEEIRKQLKKIKGIGDWTVDIYLLFVLHRRDVFPVGDLAMVKALKEIKGLPKNSSKETLLEIAERWKPYRSLATCLLWHYYLKQQNNND